MSSQRPRTCHPCWKVLKPIRSVCVSRPAARCLDLAVGNLLGLPVEGWNFREIDRSYYEGVADIDPQEAVRPMDDDLAQAVELGEALLEGGDYIGGFAQPPGDLGS